MPENRRTMVITGGAGNNGLAIVRMALQQGMNVAFLSSSHGKAQEAIAKFGAEYKDRIIGFAQNPQFKFAQNMADAPGVYDENTTQEDVLRWIYEYFGRIDIMVNGSGGHVRKNFEETDVAFWRHSMLVLEAAFFNTKLILPYLLESDAPRVINLTTCDGRAGGYFDNPSFAAARGGIVALTQELARELGPKGVTVNCVAIGHIEQDVPDEDMLTDEQRAEMLAATPLNRLGVPGDVAGIINFLASKEASFITGAVIDVNGGILMSS